jgi:hypothetical protein
MSDLGSLMTQMGNAPSTKPKPKVPGSDRLSAGQRSAMPQKEFAGPDHSFPVNDETHARLAISGATRSEHAGNISPGQEAAIKAKARAKLAGPR